jgi:hypothetical protein
MHAAGYLNNSDGSLYYRGASGYYWSSVELGATSGQNLVFTAAVSFMSNKGKAYGVSLRCVKD